MEGHFAVETEQLLRALGRGVVVVDVAAAARARGDVIGELGLLRRAHLGGVAPPPLEGHADAHQLELKGEAMELADARGRRLLARREIAHHRLAAAERLPELRAREGGALPQLPVEDVEEEREELRQLPLVESEARFRRRAALRRQEERREEPRALAEEAAAPLDLRLRLEVLRLEQLELPLHHTQALGERRLALRPALRPGGEQPPPGGGARERERERGGEQERERPVGVGDDLLLVQVDELDGGILAAARAVVAGHELGGVGRGAVPVATDAEVAEQPPELVLDRAERHARRLRALRRLLRAGPV